MNHKSANIAVELQFKARMGPHVRCINLWKSKVITVFTKFT